MSNTSDRDTNKTLPGTLNAEQLKRHKLTPGNAEFDGIADHKILNGWHHRTKLKNMVEMLSLYRLTSHKVIEKKLAKPLVMQCGYWLDSMKPEFRNRDKAPAQVGELEVDTSVAKGVPTTY
jgi:hypothetical protein